MVRHRPDGKEKDVSGKTPFVVRLLGQAGEYIGVLEAD